MWFGVEIGDCVGMLVWNGYWYLEVYYGIGGMGVVCYMINLCLFFE